MPGLSGADVDDVNFWLYAAVDFVSTSYFSTTDLHDRATKYWVAHGLTLQMAVGMDASGPIKSKKVGDVSVSHAVVDADIGSTPWLNQTQWGQLYNQMVRRLLGDVVLSI